MLSALGKSGRRYSNVALVADADKESMHIKRLAIAALIHTFPSLLTDQRVPMCSQLHRLVQHRRTPSRSSGA